MKINCSSNTKNYNNMKISNIYTTLSPFCLFFPPPLAHDYFSDPLLLRRPFLCACYRAREKNPLSGEELKMLPVAQESMVCGQFWAGRLKSGLATAKLRRPLLWRLKRPERHAQEQHNPASPEDFTQPCRQYGNCRSAPPLAEAAGLQSRCERMQMKPPYAHCSAPRTRFKALGGVLNAKGTPSVKQLSRAAEGVGLLSRVSASDRPSHFKGICWRF